MEFQEKLSQNNVGSRPKQRKKTNIKDKNTSYYESQSHINLDLLNKFQQFLKRTRHQDLQKNIQNLYGRNYAINYHDKFNFSEQWENKKKNSESEEKHFLQFFNLEEAWSEWIMIISVCIRVIVIWFLSVYRLFEWYENDLTHAVFSIGLVVILVSGAVKFYLKLTKLEIEITIKVFVLNFHKEILKIIYYLILLCTNLLKQNRIEILIIYFCLDLITIKWNYENVSSIYKEIKLKSYTSSYKNEFKLLDLLLKSLIMIHIFAVVLFGAANYDVQNNWMEHANIMNLTVMQKYIYSFYFSSTTMLTIGYGDMIPSNSFEVGVVILIQIVGVAIFMYLVNQIGITMSSMRKEEEGLEKDISVITKIKKNYRLDNEIIMNAKSYLVNNQKVNDQLYPEEENQLLSKLSDQLRTCNSLFILEIHTTNHLNIMKSSIFFICNWSKKFQVEAAKRLIKKVYSPNQTLTQSLGQQRVYVIQSGKVDIYTNKCAGFKKPFKKFLKSIDQTTSKEVSDNVYGYSTVVSGKLIKLNGIAKEFSTAYYLTKSAFMECVFQSKQDLQIFCEMRDKIEQSFCPQAWEAPSVLNVRGHYNPNHYYIIKKSIALDKLSKNKRFFSIRKNKASDIRKLKVFSKMFYEDDEDSQELVGSIIQLNSAQNLALFSSSKMNLDHRKTVIDGITFQENHKILEKTFDIAKNYNFYFTKGNIEKVLHKICMENLLSKEIVMFLSKEKILTNKGKSEIKMQKNLKSETKKKIN